MGFKDFLFPKFCLGCGLIGVYICPRCFDRIEAFPNSRCFYCDKASPNGLTHMACLQRLNADGIYSMYKYRGFLRKIIKTIKYRLATDAFDELVKTINPDHMEKLLDLKKVYKGALIQPIPLTNARLRERGFNLAHLLAKYFSRYLGLKIADYLIRKKGGTPQAEAKNKKERYLNVSHAFALRPGAKVIEKKIIVVDDVVTSGATIKAATRVFKKAGVSLVFGLSLARG